MKIKLPTEEQTEDAKGRLGAREIKDLTSVVKRD